MSVVVDRGPAPEVIDRIELEVPDRDFVGAAEVLGSPTGAEGSYATLSTTQIYAVRGAVDARSTTALFPPTDYRYLLVRARGVSDVTGATVARDPLQPRLEPVTAESRTRERERATVVRLDLGFVNVPVDAIRVQSSTDRFVRSVKVEGSNDGTTFVPVGSGEIARFRGVDLDRLAVDARHRYLRVTVDEWRRRCARGPSRDSARQLAPAPARRWPPAALRRLLRRRGHRRSGVRLRPAAGCRDRLRTGDASARSAPKPSTTSSSLRRTRAPSSRETDGLVNGLLVLAAIVVAVGGLLALRRRA